MKNRITLTAIAFLFCLHAPANQPILLIDFMNESGAANPASPDANGNYWNSVGSSSSIFHNNTDLRLTDGTVVNGLNARPYERPSSGADRLDEYGNPTSTGQWTNASPARTGQPDWVADDSLIALDDRLNLGNNSRTTLTLQGLPALAPGQWYRIEMVSAATGNFGTDHPALFNIGAENSIGGNQEGNDIGSIVPINGLTGAPLDWRDNGGTNAHRFGFAFFPNTSADTSVAPADGWIVWDGVVPNGDNEIILYTSTYASSSGNQRGPINALAVYVIPEPGTLMLVGISLVSILLFRVRSHR